MAQSSRRQTWSTAIFARPPLQCDTARTRAPAAGLRRRLGFERCPIAFAASSISCTSVSSSVAIASAPHQESMKTGTAGSPSQPTCMLPSWAPTGRRRRRRCGSSCAARRPRLVGQVEEPRHAASMARRPARAPLSSSCFSSMWRFKVAPRRWMLMYCSAQMSGRPSAAPSARRRSSRCCFSSRRASQSPPRLGVTRHTIRSAAPKS